ncbi:MULTISPECIES: SusD/RagB family nutrient-binding outer membrane lipoprotein [Amniculibacterium]|uniref:SusD/RagB family nutrient-binding outer membrane lipoprotein n=1 Tax=Amniculibacterium TaxID=2715289 RepID=UPI000F5913F2|nr:MULTISPECIES: SusD/RagB family nutrient-binding outer membrane lipoprotein [Amniculibacterium]
MKKIFTTILVATLLQSCDNDALTEINSDPNSYYTTVPSTLLTYSQKQLTDYVTTPNVNVNNFRLTMQYWQETTYTDESRYDFATRKVADQVWNYLYVRSLKNLEQAKKLVNEYQPTANEVATWPTTKKNQLAILDILQVYSYQLLVDAHGNVPYSESLDVDKFPLPKYDDGATVYAQLITRLQADIANIDAAGTSFSSGEKYYNGNMAKWKLFANSLLLKLGIAIADSNPGLAQSTCQAAIAGGVFTSAADSCGLQYLSDSPNYSQLYTNLVASNRNDYVAGKTLVDYMNARSDARRSAYFQLKNGSYIGGVIGNNSSFSTHSAPGTFAYAKTTPGIMLNYTEVAFYLAEASARWGIGGAPATLYDNAVTASFLQWGKTAADATAYLATNAYDPANWKKSIGEQAWVAMYDQPLVGWNFYRRLDYPQLAPANNAVTEANNKVPVRLMYPVGEITTNPSNYDAGSSAIGGDKLYTKIFWDKF